ncbi:MAG: chaperone modulator CbpM [Desulfobulbaceae bacterium]|jgi:chaperone modulatory protein CbpM|nr:chaperone modulator CbpM [Desulfobulbaceae bacterium]MDY0350615.1 chaperone modulator CbpM [Desulfobulbaceae bacterium]
MTNEIIILNGTILDEETEFSLLEICSICTVPAELVRDMVDEGLINPKGSGPKHWRFTSLEIRRIKRTVRLHRDLGINIPGCALVLELLDELEELRRLSRCP